MRGSSRLAGRLAGARWLAVVAVLVATLVALPACGDSPSVAEPAAPEQPVAAAPQEEVSGQPQPDAAEEEMPPASNDSAASDRAAQAEPFDLSKLPSYTGSPYTLVADGVPALTAADAEGLTESYSPLDALGRCGTAMALVGPETMPTEERGSIGMIKPSGWHTVRYDDLVDGKYLYNRCHLIGYQLSGENANERNLVTGTRYMNTEGMLPFENQVADYVERTGNHVIYRAAPVFVGSELVCRGVHLEARSLEDDGAGVSLNVFCYNVQPGVGIDYATGDSWREESSAPQEPQAKQSEERTYVLNTNTRKFHYPECRSVDQMSEKNKQEFTGTREEVIAQGYDPCGNCNP